MDTKVFKGLRLVISTPNMGQSVCDQYADSRAETERLLMSLGVGWYPSKVRDTYIPRGRNVLAAAMLETDASHHLWLDSDMGWNSQDLIRMLYHVCANPEIEIIGAPYPQKHIDWERVKAVVLSNPKVTPRQLACCASGLWTSKGLDDGQYNLGAPIQLKQIGEQMPHVGTGVMVVKRKVYEKMRDSLPIAYLDKTTGKTMWRFFHCDTNDKGEWIGEDTWFCRAWHRLDGKMWLAPWVRTEHVGAISFPGDIGEIVDAGVELPT